MVYQPIGVSELEDLYAAIADMCPYSDENFDGFNVQHGSHRY